ncbi:MAG: hypothetical protein FIA97_08660 [Methylococcaceae bacterium]|nr:hypothetical protein [Methylococcaceae bacterium]
MKLYRYQNQKGNFDYERYRAAQVAGNKEKLHANWCDERCIKSLAGYILRNVSNVSFGLCHGARRDHEQRWFREVANIEVIGTEISDTATQFPNTIQWDFHEVKEEWLGGVDFIYSNAYDHSYDPNKLFNAWFSCLKLGGLCILEYTKPGHQDEQVTEMDPFGLSIEELVHFIIVIGTGRYIVREIISEFPFQYPDYFGRLEYIVVERRY